MSEFTNIDKLDEAARAAREKVDAAIQKALPPGAMVAVRSGSEYLGRFVVQEYPAQMFGQLLIKNEESGAERRAGYRQVKVIDQ